MSKWTYEAEVFNFIKYIANYQECRWGIAFDRLYVVYFVWLSSLVPFNRYTYKYMHLLKCHASYDSMIMMKSPTVALLHPRELPSRQRSCIQSGFAGRFFLGKQFITSMDAYSKWLEVAVVSLCSILKLSDSFDMCTWRMEVPNMLVSDNSIAFTSEEFKIFVKCNGIHHIPSTLYYPTNNSLAERAVQTF